MRAVLVRTFPLLLAACVTTADTDSESRSSSGGCSSSSAGDLGRGDFAALECTDTNCLTFEHLATGALSRMTFRTSVPVKVGRIMSSAPAVLSIDGTVIDPGQELTTFDVHGGAPGTTKLFALRPGDTVIDELSVTVEDVARVEATVAPQVVVGGEAALTGQKFGFTGTALFGRGGFVVTAPAGLRVSPAPAGMGACGWFSVPADFAIHADTVGTYQLAVWPSVDTPSLPLTVVERTAVVGLEAVATSFGTGNGAFTAGVLPSPVDAGGTFVDGVRCTWSASRPVQIDDSECMVLITSATNAPVDLTCRFDDRVLGTVHIDAAPAQN